MSVRALQQAVITVTPKNYVVTAEVWSLILCNADGIIVAGVHEVVPISQAISFLSFLATPVFPLRFFIGFYKWSDPSHVAVTAISTYNSYDPSFEGYVQSYIPSYGTYEFNYQTLTFDPVGVPATPISGLVASSFAKA